MRSARPSRRPLVLRIGCVIAVLGVASPVVADPIELLSPGSHASVGLGGDPFLSSLRDETGWWSERGFARGPGATMEASFSRPVSRSMLGGASLERREVSWTARRDLGLGGHTGIAARVARPTWRGSWSADPGGVAIGGAGAAVELAARLATRTPALTLEIDAPALAPDAAARGSSAGAGLRFDRGGRLALQASWSSVRAPEALATEVHGEDFAASLNLHSDAYRLDGRWALGRSLAIEGSAAQSRQRSLRVPDASAGFAIAPRGHGDLEQIALHARPTARTRALARWTRRHLDADASLLQDGTTFGALEGARGDLESVLLGLERRHGPRSRELLEGEHARGSASARGEVESWPFTTALVDLLGLRGIGTVDASLRWSRLHAAIERGIGRSLDLRGGLGFYDLEPDAIVESWRPMFLVFGRADLETHRLEARRVQLGAVSLGTTLRARGIALDLGARQFVFARVFRDAKAGQAAAPASAEPTGAAGSPQRGRVPGATEAELSLSRSF
jgi:hypothetical protein